MGGCLSIYIWSLMIWFITRYAISGSKWMCVIAKLGLHACMYVCIKFACIYIDSCVGEKWEGVWASTSNPLWYESLAVMQWVEAREWCVMTNFNWLHYIRLDIFVIVVWWLIKYLVILTSQETSREG